MLHPPLSTSNPVPSCTHGTRSGRISWSKFSFLNYFVESFSTSSTGRAMDQINILGNWWISWLKLKQGLFTSTLPKSDLCKVTDIHCNMKWVAFRALSSLIGCIYSGQTFGTLLSALQFPLTPIIALHTFRCCLLAAASCTVSSLPPPDQHVYCTLYSLWYSTEPYRGARATYQAAGKAGRMEQQWGVREPTWLHIDVEHKLLPLYVQSKVRFWASTQTTAGVPAQWY